jgi:F-type H+-transporting ATPase subunit b
VSLAVTLAGAVVFQQEGDGGETTTTAETTTKKDPPNPILPVGKEMAWGFGSFIVLALLMRFWLFPRVKKGMDARYAHIQSDLSEAERTRAAAEAEVARYEDAMAEARAAANRLIDAARADVEADRSAKLGAAGARIAERRAEASAQQDAARRAALAQLTEAVVEVSASAAERVLGSPVDRDSARSIVADVMAAGVTQ